jgi:hypothetical protein
MHTGVFEIFILVLLCGLVWYYLTVWFGYIHKFKLKIEFWLSFIPFYCWLYEVYKFYKKLK